LTPSKILLVQSSNIFLLQR